MEFTNRKGRIHSRGIQQLMLFFTLRPCPTTSKARRSPVTRHQLAQVMSSMLKSQSLLASAMSLAFSLGSYRLLSQKYFPDAPFTCGWRATQHVVAAPCLSSIYKPIRYQTSISATQAVTCSHRHYNDYITDFIKHQAKCVIHMTRRTCYTKGPTAVSTTNEDFFFYMSTTAT